MRFFSFLFFFALSSPLAFAETCRPLFAEPDATLADCAGVKVLRLRGTPVERARKLGALVHSGQLSNEPLRYFIDKVGLELRQTTGWLSGPLELAYNQIVRLFHRSAPVALEEEIDAMAGSLDIDPILLRRGLSLPDTGSFLQGLGSYPLFHFLPAVGCTSLAARLPDGGFAYGRNLDFAGVGIWDAHPMLLAVEPAPGSRELRHLVIGADGMPFAGITGVNEAGITFAVHQNYSRDISLRGVPMVLIGELTLRSAHTLKEAIEILQANRPANLWTFVLTDLRQGEAVAVESSQRLFLVRHMEGNLFAQTNHLMHAESRSSENSSFGVEANSLFRMEEAFRQMEAARPYGAESLAKILAWQASPLGELTAYRDILKANTLQTVLFETSAGKEPALSLSVDPAPTASGHFAHFSLAQFWKDGPLHWEPRDYAGTPAEVRLRQRAAAMAFHLYFDENKPVEASALMAAQKTFDAALFRCVAMATAGRFSDSLRLADEALRDPRFLGEPAYVRESFQRIKLIALLKLHRENEARALAQTVVEGREQGLPGPSKQKLVEIATHVLQREWIPDGMLALHFDFFSGDLSGRKN